jgi:ribosomal protein L7/L12
MPSITSQWIVDRLITTPKNEFESGMNSAYISILKEIAPSKVTDPLQSDRDALLHTIGPSNYNKLTEPTILELGTYRQTNQKLAWVKLYKETFGEGLKESKEMADSLWEKFKQFGQ